MLIKETGSSKSTFIKIGLCQITNLNKHKNPKEQDIQPYKKESE
jgi:hypothetical protein